MQIVKQYFASLSFHENEGEVFFLAVRCIALSTFVRAIRFYSATGPRTGLQRGIRFYPAAFQQLNFFQQNFSYTSTPHWN